MSAPRVGTWLAAATALGVVAPASALASSFERVKVSVVGGRSALVISQIEDPDQSRATLGNALSIRSEGAQSVIVTEANTGIPLHLESGSCSQRSATEATCSLTFVSYRITTGEGADNVDLSGLSGKAASPATIDGGEASDRIVGSSADDTLNGDGMNGRDDAPTPAAGDGDDTLIGGDGSDVLNGGGGDDVLTGSSTTMGDAEAQNVLNGGDGSDLFLLGWSLGADQVNGGTGGEHNSGLYSQPLAGLTQIHGDKVSYEARVFLEAGSVGVSADLDGVADDGAAGEADRIGTDVESLDGSVRDDTLTGNNEGNELVGGLGRDTIVAGAGDDRVDLRDGIADACPSVSPGNDTVIADLADQVAIAACQRLIESFALHLPVTLMFLPVDETTRPATIGRRVTRSGPLVRVPLSCPRSPQRTCAGTLSIAAAAGGPALAQATYRVPRDAARVVRLRVGARALRFARLTIVEPGVSLKGPKTVEVVRHLSAGRRRPARGHAGSHSA